MKAITLIQPWATLVAIGAKRIETRSWKTNYRGPLAIHAGKNFPNEARGITIGTYPIAKALHDAGFGKLKDLPLGAVVATCELIDCVKVYRVVRQEISTTHGVHFAPMIKVPPDEPELSFGDYTPGRYAWILANVKALPEPIPAKGAQGFWEWNP